MININNVVYPLACLSFSIIISAGIYEHLAIWPRLLSTPPTSLSMFQGESGLNALVFWPKIHPLALLILITTLAISWKSKRRKNVLVVLIGYLLIIGITFIYFIPELIQSVSTEYATAIDESLKIRGDFWEKLSLLRIAIAIGLAILLFLGLTKPTLKAE